MASSFEAADQAVWTLGNIAGESKALRSRIVTRRGRRQEQRDVQVLRRQVLEEVVIKDVMVKEVLCYFMTGYLDHHVLDQVPRQERHLQRLHTRAATSRWDSATRRRGRTATRLRQAWRRTWRSRR